MIFYYYGFCMLYYVYVIFDILIKIKNINLIIVVSIIFCMLDWWLIFGVIYLFCNEILLLIIYEKVFIDFLLIYKILMK